MKDLIFRLKLAWRALTRRHTFAVIYDNADMVDENPDAAEQYYGWFTDPAEARSVFTMFKGGNEAIVEAKLVLVLEDLP